MRIAPAPVFGCGWFLRSYGRGDFRGLAALQEDIPADATEEEQRGGDLAGLGHGGGRYQSWICDVASGKNSCTGKARGVGRQAKVNVIQGKIIPGSLRGEVAESETQTCRSAL